MTYRPVGIDVNRPHALLNSSTSAWLIMYICVDFDGTIVDHAFPSIGKPVPGAIEWLKRFNELGGKLILFTIRSNEQKYGNVLTHAVDFLNGKGVELFGINRNPTQDQWTSSPKAYGQIYIDDAAVGCPIIHPDGFVRPCVDWSIIGPYVEAALISTRVYEEPATWTAGPLIPATMTEVRDSDKTDTVKQTVVDFGAIHVKNTKA